MSSLKTGSSHQIEVSCTRYGTFSTHLDLQPGRYHLYVSYGCRKCGLYSAVSMNSRPLVSLGNANTHRKTTEGTRRYNWCVRVVISNRKVTHATSTSRPQRRLPSHGRRRMGVRRRGPLPWNGRRSPQWRQTYQGPLSLRRAQLHRPASIESALI